MFCLTKNTLEKIFTTGSMFEKASVHEGSKQAVSTIRQFNSLIPVCRVCAVSMDETRMLLEDATHKVWVNFDADKTGQNDDIIVGSVIIIKEYSLKKECGADKLLGGNMDFQLVSTKMAITNDSNHILIVTAYQTIGFDNVLKITVELPEAGNQIPDVKIALLRPNIQKSFIKFKGMLTQIGK